MTRRTPWFRSPRLRRKLLSSQGGERTNAGIFKRRNRRLLLERLEDRSLLAAFNDPDYASIQWGLNNIGQNGGTYDVDIDAPEAWAVTTGSMTTVLAEIDDGINYTHADVYLNIRLSQGEIPPALRASLTDIDADGLITFRDLNNPANSAYVSDLNATGFIDGGDLLQDTRWANGVDDEGNGKVDDLVGWDFLDNDNDPMPVGGGGGHGTGMAQWIGGIPNNGIGKVGVNWQISMMPVRIRPGTETEVDYAVQASGLDYAVESGVPISAIWGVGTTYSQAMYDAIDRARVAGDLVVAPAGNDAWDNDVTPRYPASFNLDNIIATTAFNPNDGMDAVWNWGLTSVDLAGPTAPGGGTSGGAAHVAGVAALLKTIHPDWNAQQLKERILSTVEPSAALLGKTVTGGRLNAARALADTSISISDPTILEGDAGTAQLVFNVTRFGVNSGSVTLNWSTANGSATAGNDYLAGAGQITFSAGGSNSQAIVVQIKGDTIQESTEVFYINLTLASGSALLIDSTGQGSILDNDVTKFYVVNDGSPDRTYEYGPGGNAYETYAIANANTASRGAASTIAGDKVWVIDANRNVYVYNASGGLLGSWTAGTVNPSAQLEGITTNGTDIWIVDAKQDKVFKYTGAATRLSGSQNAASSFNLNSGNAGPKDLVTDGASIWVVNDSSTDKVFKYNLTGTLLGSWTISTSGVTAPTGITLDPASPSHLWIVDSGTDRVYQYDTAVTRTSGSQAASTSFALATGNTNPQGIADPPGGGSSASAVDAGSTGDIAAAPVLAGFPAFAGTGQVSTLTGDQDEQDALALYLSDVGNPAALLSADSDVKAENSMAGTRLFPTRDDALCGIADELDSLTPVSGRRIRPPGSCPRPKAVFLH